MKQFILNLAAVISVSSAAFAGPVLGGNIVILETQQFATSIFSVIPTAAEDMADQSLPIATSSGFVIGSESVLVIDTMLNRQLNAQLLALIAAETDLPIRYAVNTRFHADHTYGNQYLADEMLIIQHSNASAYIWEHLEADKAFMIQNFGQGRGIKKIVITPTDILVGKGGDLNVNLGGITVNIRCFGFAQTGGDLFVSVPSANVLWTDNTVIAKAPALPWLLEGHLLETLDTLQVAFENFNGDTIVIPGHRSVTDISAIKWNIDYLTATERKVTIAITDGLSLEDTVARVQLKEPGGYALFGWSHPVLTVPAAYSDLKLLN